MGLAIGVEVGFLSIYKREKTKNGNQLEKIKKVVDKEVCHMYNSLSVDRSKVCY